MLSNVGISRLSGSFPFFTPSAVRVMGASYSLRRAAPGLSGAIPTQLRWNYPRNCAIPAQLRGAWSSDAGWRLCALSPARPSARAGPYQSGAVSGPGRRRVAGGGRAGRDLNRPGGPLAGNAPAKQPEFVFMKDVAIVANLAIMQKIK